MLILLFGSFIVLCLLEVPMAFALFISAAVTILVQGDVPVTIVAQKIWGGLNNFPLMAVPFFLFVGQLMNETDVSRRLINFSQSVVGHLKGGLAHVVVVVSTIFAGISGASSAEASGIGSVMIPAMKNSGYPTGFTVGLISSSAILGNIIPPSIMMIVYAATAGLSVSVMFLMGYVPGLMIGGGYMIYSYFYAKKYGIGGDKKFSLLTFFKSTKVALFALVIPVIIMGGIKIGTFTATEASVIAVVYVFVLTLFYRTINVRKLYDVMKNSVGLFSLSLFCVAAASMWGWLLAYYNVPQMIVTPLQQAGLLNSQLFVFAFLILMFLLIGTFMDAVPAIIIMMPIVKALASHVGINPYHMGIVVVLTLAIGLITPPYGLCLMIAADLAKIPMLKAMKSMIPFYIISLIVVLIAVFFPDLMLWIPRLALPDFMK
jgi:tripartite ATP-independent transporter DctM subunit